MRSWKRLLKHEIDADYTAGIYTLCVGWLLSLFRYLAGRDGVGFWQLTWVLILCWFMAWFQKLLFWGEKPAARKGGRLRSLLWWLVPSFTFSAGAVFFGWLNDCPAWAFWGFCLSVTATLLSWWICIQFICKDDTERWNEMLTQFKARESEAK